MDTHLKARERVRKGEAGTHTHPHRPSSSAPTGPPHATLRLRQKVHATGVPRLYGFFAIVVPAGAVMGGELGPGSAEVIFACPLLDPATPSGILRPVVGE